jgi:cell shape-determining protein MreD
VLVPAVALNLLWLPVVYFPLRLRADRLGDPRIGWER